MRSNETQHPSQSLRPRRHCPVGNARYPGGGAFSGAGLRADRVGADHRQRADVGPLAAVARVSRGVGVGRVWPVRIPFSVVHRLAPRAAGAGQSGELPLALVHRGAGAAALARGTPAVGACAGGWPGFSGGGAGDSGRSLVRGGLGLGLPSGPGVGSDLGYVLAGQPPHGAVGQRVSHGGAGLVRPDFGPARAGLSCLAGAAFAPRPARWLADRGDGAGAPGRRLFVVGPGAETG